MRRRKTLGERLVGAALSHFFAENQPELERLAHVVGHTAETVKRKLEEVKAEEESSDEESERPNLREKLRKKRERKGREKKEPEDVVELKQGKDGVWERPT